MDIKTTNNDNLTYVIRQTQKRIDVLKNIMHEYDYSYKQIPIDSGVANKIILDFANDEDCRVDSCSIKQSTNPYAYDYLIDYMKSQVITHEQETGTKVKTEPKTKKVVVKDNGKYCLLDRNRCITLLDRTLCGSTNPDVINASYKTRVCIDDYTGRQFWNENPSRKVYADEELGVYYKWRKYMDNILSKQLAETV